MRFDRFFSIKKICFNDPPKIILQLTAYWKEQFSFASRLHPFLDSVIVLYTDTMTGSFLLQFARLGDRSMPSTPESSPRWSSLAGLIRATPTHSRRHALKKTVACQQNSTQTH